jgi:photosystem II stability/assembly factor-like uncharacterized protein
MFFFFFVDVELASLHDYIKNAKRIYSYLQRSMRHLATLAVLLTLLLGTVPASAQEVTWEPTGGPTTGSATDLDAHGDYVYADVGPEIYRSSDGGRTWTSIDSSGVSLEVSSEGVLLAASGIFCRHSCSQSVVERSADAGNTWTDIQNVVPGELMYDWAAGANGILFANTDQGLFSSADSGATWQNVEWPGSASGRSESLAARTDGTVVIAGDSTVYFSSDNGATWETNSYDPGLVSLRSLEIGPDGTFFSVGYDARFAFRSTDRGTTRTALRPEATDTTLTSISVLDDGTVYLGTRRGALRSTDGGDTWTAFGLNDLAVFDFIRAEPGTLLAATKDAVYRRDEASGTWQTSSAGILRWNIYALAQEPDGDVLASANFLGGDLSRTSDRGETWEQVASFFSIETLSVAPDGTIYAGGTRGKFVNDLHRSTDGGRSWTALGLRNRNIDALVRTQEGTLLAGSGQSTEGLYRSTDDGDDWQLVLEERARALLETEGGTLYASTLDDDAVDHHNRVDSILYRSTDDGASWTQTDLQDAAPVALAASGGAIFATNRTQVLRSTDDGDSWPVVYEAASRVRALQAASNGDLFAGTGEGVLRSSDGGDTWRSIAEWPRTRRESKHPLLIGRQGYVYTGVRNRGVFRSSEPAISTARDPAPQASSGFALDPAHPNPFRQRATIPFTLSQAARVTLTAYDVLGRRVAEVASERYAAGTHEVTWNAGELPSGVYVLRLKANGRVATRSVTVVR